MTANAPDVQSEKKPSPKSRRKLAADLEELARRKRENRLSYYEPYTKQKEFHETGNTHRQRLFMAGNQLGKSLCGSMEFGMHLTGNYPAWWNGKRYSGPIKAWATGVTSASTRDNPQRLLMGDTAHGTGSIPKDAIHKVEASRGLAGAVDTALIKHISGGLSKVRFLSYELGREKWQGETLDLIWFDEEPPIDIYTEGLARLSARKGHAFITFTPLQGMSDVVILFLQDESGGRHTTRMEIDEALHIDEEERKNIIAAYPEHEREARTKGIPMLGSGRVFNIPEDMLKEEPGKLPPHWPRICGMDYGWSHPSAAAWLAWDRDNDTVHIYDTYRKAEETPAIHAAAIKARGKWIPVAWPHDGLQHDKGSGVPLANIYRDSHDLNMLPNRTEFEGGGYGVEAGIAMMLDMMHTERLRVREDLSDWWDEFRMYHRKDGRIVKVRDDLMAATRYAIMSLRYAETENEARDRWKPIEYDNRGIV